MRAWVFKDQFPALGCSSWRLGVRLVVMVEDRGGLHEISWGRVVWVVVDLGVVLALCFRHAVTEPCLSVQRR
jgi:hypothetical protein